MFLQDDCKLSFFSRPQVVTDKISFYQFKTSCIASDFHRHCINQMEIKHTMNLNATPDQSPKAQSSQQLSKDKRMSTQDTQKYWFAQISTCTILLDGNISRVKKSLLLINDLSKLRATELLDKTGATMNACMVLVSFAKVIQNCLKLVRLN